MSAAPRVHTEHPPPGNYGECVCSCSLCLDSATGKCLCTECCASLDSDATPPVETGSQPAGNREQR